MEILYYILDSETNEIIIDNLSYEQGIDWLTQNGIPTKHIITPKTNDEDI